MAPRTYLNFDLLFETEGDGRFRARVVDSPDGSHPYVDFGLPFDPLTLENLLLKLDPGRSGTRRGAAGPQVQAGRQLGRALFDAVFTDDVAISWARAKGAARSGGMGVRVRLHLADAPVLSALPWELLHDDRTNTFLAQSERTPVVRFLDVGRAQPPLRVDGPLRILVVIPAPTDLADLDVEAEWTHVQEALAPRVRAGQVAVDRLPAPTLSDLGRWLRTHPVHVLHFIGHGDLDPHSGDGVLYFCDDYGRSTPVSAAVLGPYVLDHDPLRLLVLNACRSASTAATDPFSGMAQGLVQQRAAAVVAMQFPITDRAATAFTEEFYGALTDGFPVDQAVSHARKALLAGYGAEWATPTVFLNALDGQLFDEVVPAKDVGVVDPGPTVAEAVPVEEPAPAPVEQPAPAPALVEEPAPAASSPPGAAAPEGKDRAAQEDVDDVEVPAPVLGPVLLADPLEDRPEPSLLVGLEAVEPEEPVEEAYVFGSARRHQRRRTVLLGGGAATALLTAVLLYTNLSGRDPAAGPLEPGGTPGPGSTPSATVTDDPTASAEADLQAVRLTARIDAGDQEWADAPRYVSDRHVAGTGEPVVRAEWRLGWDDEHYYLYVTVTDPTFTAGDLDNPSQLWRGDSVHLELGPADTDAAAGTLDGWDRHVLVGPGETGQVVVQHNVPDTTRTVFTGGPRSTGAQAAVWFGDGGYTLEAAIPWSELTGVTPSAGDRFVSNLNVSDADASGAGAFRSMWSSNPDRTGNGGDSRSSWTTLLLAG